MLPLVRSFEEDRVFEALFSRWAQRPHTIRLQGGWDVAGTGRYTFLGVDPYRVLTAYGSTIVDECGSHRMVWTGDPFKALDAVVQTFNNHPRHPDFPIPFQGGGMGYLGYGLRHFVEKVPARHRLDLPTPDLYFAFYDVVAVYDHLQRRGHLFSSGLPARGAQAQERARERLDQMWAQMIGEKTSVSSMSGAWQTSEEAALDLLRPEHSATEKKAYIEAVQKAKEYIAAGDIYQVNYSHRFSVPARCSGEQLFHVLRDANPSPFGAYVQGGNWTVISVSPERFFHYDGKNVETRPIKGTRPRATDRAEDEALRDELLVSVKDRAEHLMIVDLERNDLGRFCTYGSVHVPELMVSEAHPTVWHMVSTVRGEPRPGVSLIEAVRSLFPGGSITGAPKVRAMEIIDELESVARGVYTGSIGYIGLEGTIDLNIAIRTLCLTGGRAYFHVGGAIVADSDPQDEYEETLAKGLGIARGLARVPFESDARGEAD